MRGIFVDSLFRYYYGRLIDYNLIFYDWVRPFIFKGSVALDLGAGAGLNTAYDFANIAHRMIGIDLDPRIMQNPNIKEPLCMNFYENQFPDNMFDVVFANSVIEHIEHPELFLSEVKRILKPDGYFFCRTPNILHYAMILSKYTPYWFHKFYCGLSGRDYEDTFPTYYRMNSEKQIAELGRKLGFEYEIKTFEGQPDYLFLDPVTFMMGVGYERLVNKYKFLNKYRILLLVKIQFNRQAQ